MNRERMQMLREERRGRGLRPKTLDAQVDAYLDGLVVALSLGQVTQEEITKLLSSDLPDEISQMIEGANLSQIEEEEKRGKLKEKFQDFKGRELIGH